MEVIGEVHGFGEHEIVCVDVRARNGLEDGSGAVDIGGGVEGEVDDPTREEWMADQTGGYRIRMEGVGVECVVAAARTARTARTARVENVTEDWMRRKRRWEKTEVCL